MEALRPKPYLSLSELSELTPWTPDGIRGMIRRGVLRSGKEYFWVGRRVVFRWESIVVLIEREPERRPESAEAPVGTVPMLNGGRLVVPKA